MSRTTERGGLTYRDAGVDIAAATGGVAQIKRHAQRTLTAGAAGPIGRFGGTYRLPAGPEQVLVASADGVGTKLKVAVVLGGEAHTQIGADLVNHCVNDILTLGARPLFFLDYFAAGRLETAVLERVVAGMADACVGNGLALIGGETAELPGMYVPGEYDVAGFIVGTVAPATMVDGAAIRPGDVLIGLPSDGLHTNGYSLARRIVGLTGEPAADRARLAQPLPGGDGESFGEALMRPHRSYQGMMRPLLDAGIVRGMAHITGGGLIDNVPRMLPDGFGADLDVEWWPAPPIFAYLVGAGDLAPMEAYRTFNMGIGFVLAVAPADRAAALAALPDGRVIGEVVRITDDGPRVRGLDGGRTG